MGRLLHLTCPSCSSASAICCKGTATSNTNSSLRVAQGYMAAMDLGLEARYKDVRTS